MTVIIIICVKSGINIIIKYKNKIATIGLRKYLLRIIFHELTNEFINRDFTIIN